MDDIIDQPDNSLKDEGKEIKTMQELKAMRESVQMFTMNALEKDTPRVDILDEMVEQYGSKHERLIVQDVAMLIKPSSLKESKIWIYVLVALHLILAGLSIYGFIPQFGAPETGILSYFFFGIVILIDYWIIKSLLTHPGRVLGVILLLGVFSIVGEGLKLISNTADSISLALLICGILSAGIAYYLRKKLLPHLGLFGPVKNKNGGYKL